VGYRRIVDPVFLLAVRSCGTHRTAGDVQGPADVGRFLHRDDVEPAVRCLDR
jgi:hypothetical protein